MTGPAPNRQAGQEQCKNIARAGEPARTTLENNQKGVLAMPTATVVQPDCSSQTGREYPPIVDGDIAVLARLEATFAPHSQSVPDMTVLADSEHFMLGQTLVQVAQQIAGPFIPPNSNHTTDRIVIGSTSEARLIIVCTEAKTPLPPIILQDHPPIAPINPTTEYRNITN